MSADQVFLNDAFRVLRSDIAIPRTFWVHDADRSACADAQALAFRTVKRTIRSGNVELLHPSLQVQPRPFTVLEICAIRPQTDEQMTGQLSDAEQCG